MVLDQHIVFTVIWHRINTLSLQLYGVGSTHCLYSYMASDQHIVFTVIWCWINTLSLQLYGVGHIVKDDSAM